VAGVDPKTAKKHVKRESILRICIGIVCCAGLAGVFLFQRMNIAGLVGINNSQAEFFFNRSVRFFLNDFLAIGLIYALFAKRKYVIFSLWVQVAGVVLLLLPYFCLKVFFPGYNGPLISFLHRLILNPTLLMLLIPLFYRQERTGLGQQ
jgi:exosortase F-associated protein